MRLSIISEATLDDIQARLPVFAKKYGLDISNLDVIRDLVSADPTNGKYSEWIIRNYRKGVIRYYDVDGLRGFLEFFHRKRSKLKNKDINAYTPRDLAELANQEYSLTKSERKSARRGGLSLPPGAKHLGNYGNFDVVEITDPEAATFVCSGTKWCTANLKTATQYIDDGPLYMVFVDGQRRYLVEYVEFQVKDIYDDAVDINTALQVHEAIDSVTGGEVTSDPMLLLYIAQAAGEELPPKYEEIILNDPDYGEQYSMEFGAS